MWQITKMWRYLIPFCALLPAPVLSQESCSVVAAVDADLQDTQAICRNSQLMGGGAQQSCYWTFDYRDAAATAQLEYIRAKIETCLGPDAASEPDAQVNHPDSFTLHQYEGQGIRVALSLKDKAGLGQSLVFLSLSRMP